MTLAFLGVSSKKGAYRHISHIILSTHNKQQVGIKVSAQKKGRKNYDSYKYVFKFRWFQVWSPLVLLSCEWCAYDSISCGPIMNCLGIYVEAVSMGNGKGLVLTLELKVFIVRIQSFSGILKQEFSATNI